MVKRAARRRNQHRAPGASSSHANPSTPSNLHATGDNTGAAAPSRALSPIPPVDISLDEGATVADRPQGDISDLGASRGVEDEEEGDVGDLGNAEDVAMRESSPLQENSL